MSGRFGAAVAASVREWVCRVAHPVGARAFRARPRLEWPPPGPMGLLLRSSGITDAVLSVAVSADGTRCVTGAGDAVVVWAIETAPGARASAASCGDVARVLSRHRAPVLAVGFWRPESSPSQRVVSADASGVVLVWDVELGECLCCREVPHSSCTADGEGARSEPHATGAAASGDAAHARGVCVSDDGALVAFGFGRAVVVTDHARASVLVVGSCREAVTAAAFLPGGASLAVGDADGRIVLLRTGGGATEPLWAYRHPVAPSAADAPGCRAVVCVAPSADGRALAVGRSGVAALLLLDASDGCLLRVFGGRGGAVNCLAFSPASPVLAAGSPDGVIRVWDTRSWKCCLAWGAHCAGVTALAFSRGGARLASASFDRSARVSCVSRRDGAGAAAAAEVREQPLVTLAVPSPDGRWVAVGDGSAVDGVVRVVSAASVPERPPRELSSGGRGAVCSLGWSPDCKRLGAGFASGDVALWVRTTGALLWAAAAAHAEAVRSLAFSHDGATLHSGSAGAPLRAWDAVSGAALAGDSGLATALALRGCTCARIAPPGAGGALAAGGTHDGTVLVVNGAGAVVRSASGHSRAVTALAWSPTRHLVASGSDDCTVRVLECDALSAGDAEGRHGPSRAMARRHYGTVHCVCVSPDGQRVGSCGEDGAVVLSDVASGACSAVVMCPFETTHLAWSRELSGGLSLLFAGFAGRPRVSHCELLLAPGGAGAPSLPRCAPEDLVPDGVTSGCGLCAHAFGFHRRHHCRACGGVFCDRCTRVAAPGCACAFCAGAGRATERRLCRHCATAHAVAASADDAWTPCAHVPPY